jgi:hypothetical protein
MLSARVVKCVFSIWDKGANTEPASFHEQEWKLRPSAFKYIFHKSVPRAMLTLAFFVFKLKPCDDILFTSLID